MLREDVLLPLALDVGYGETFKRKREEQLNFVSFGQIPTHHHVMIEKFLYFTTAVFYYSSMWPFRALDPITRQACIRWMSNACD